MEAILKKEIVINKGLSRIIIMMIFVTLISLGAFVRIPLPFTPVPITLQTFFVLLSAAVLGANSATAVQLIYILSGMLGLPIFTGAGSGLFYLLGPTGGYLLGFILAGLFVGRLIKYAKNNAVTVFLILFAADLILLSCGTFWLHFISGYTLVQSLFIGFIPFVPGDLLKVFFAAILYLKLKARLREVL